MKRSEVKFKTLKMLLSVVYCHTHHRGYIIAADLPDYSVPPTACQLGVNCTAECDAYIDSHLELDQLLETVREVTPLIDRSGGNWRAPFFYGTVVDLAGQPWSSPVLSRFFADYRYDKPALFKV
jgi:hypothetical protein